MAWFSNAGTAHAETCSMRRICGLAIWGTLSLGVIHPGQAAPRGLPNVTIGSIHVSTDWPGRAAWSRAPLITLAQQNPHPGGDTPFATTIRSLSGGQYIWFRIVCTDPDPSRTVVHTLVRDGDQSGDDNVMIVLDPFAQKKLGYVFQVNARGAMADGLISPGYLDPNTNLPVDYSWNGYWKAVVKRTATGWTADITIDTRSLQFDNRQDAWGLNISRYVPRAQLTLAWSGINLNATVTNLQWEGGLDGMRNLSQGSGFEFNPHVAGIYSDENRRTITGKAGFDIKYDFTPGLAGLFTYRPDFYEAPADTLTATLSPYPQSNPETRQFFLDGSNIFTFGHNLGQAFMPFYSRNVGLVNGETVPLNEGVKLLGHAGAWTLGMLDAQMDSSAVSKATNLFVGRASYNLSSQWQVGTLITHGDPLGQSDNTLLSFDSTWSTGTFHGDKTLAVSAWGARSYGNALPGGSPIGYGVDAAYPNDLWWMDFHYNYYGSGLDPALGFVQRPGTKQSYVDINWQPRPGPDGLFSWVRQFDLFFTYNYVTDLDNRVESEEWHFFPIQFTTQNGWSMYLSVRPSFERLTSPYEIIPGVTLPIGDYRFTSETASVSTPSSNAWGVTLEYESGGLYSGHYRAMYPVLNWAAPDGKFSANLQPVWIEFFSPQGNGSVRAERLDLNDSFTPGLSLSDLIQYNNITHSTSVNARLQWYIRPNRVMYVVWNHGLTLDPNLLQGGRQAVTGNSLVVKLAWGFF